MKEIRVPMRKWEDDSDNLAGFGLVEERDAVQPKIRKVRPKRPEASDLSMNGLPWTSLLNSHIELVNATAPTRHR